MLKSAPPRARISVALTALGLVAALVLACSGSAVGVDVCKRIETARCAESPRCGIDLTHPAHGGGTADDVAACDRFYDDACLHGLATSVVPSSTDVDTCVAAIHAGTCDVVLHPETVCVWLVPPVVDAGVEASVDGGDASTDAATE